MNTAPRLFATPLLVALLASCGKPGGAAPDQGNGVVITSDVVYGRKAGMALTLDVYRPPRPNGAGVIYIVSSAWYSRWSPTKRAVGQFAELLNRGFTVFRVRHGSSPYFKIQQIFADVERAVRFIRSTAADYGVDPERLGVVGGSAGGHLALLVATSSDDGNPASRDEVGRTSSRVAAVVALHPPVDLRSEVARRAEARRNTGEKSGAEGGTGPALDIDVEQGALYSPLLHISPDDPPALLIHGDRDELIPLTNSQQMYATLRENGVATELIVLEGAGHLFDGEHAMRARRETAEWFVKHLLNAK